MIGYSLRAATFALIGFRMSETATDAFVIMLDRVISGQLWGLLLAVPLLLCLGMVGYSLREVAGALRSL